MLEALILKARQPRCLTILLLAAAAAALSSCASSKPQTALVNDPDAQASSSIPWNKPAQWEGRGNLPTDLGSSRQGDAFGGNNTGGTGGY
jgi:hypothetical protein